MRFRNREEAAAPTATDRRVVRGGAWVLPASVCRSAYRFTGWLPPDGSNPVVGFRVARTVR